MLHADRKTPGASDIGRDRVAAGQLDRPIVQRTRDALAVDDALRQRAALVRTAVEHRKYAIAGGAEYRDVAVGVAASLDNARAEYWNVGERADERVGV